MKKSKSKPGSASTGGAQSAVRQRRIALLEALDNLEDAKERLEACAAISSKFEPLDEDDSDEILVKMKKEIVALGRDGMFKSLVRCANDVDPVVKLTAIGALRNLAIVGQDKSLALMQQEDAWSAMCTVLSNSQPTNANAQADWAARKEALHVMELMCEWSESVAERRLPESLHVVEPYLRLSSQNNSDTIEAAAKLLFVSIENNEALAKAILSSDAGKALGRSLELLVQTLASKDSIQTLVAGSYALGILLNISCIGGIPELATLVAKWFEMCRPILSQEALPVSRLSEQIVVDAKEFEEADMQENGDAKKESDVMRQYLDVVQAQALIFDFWGDLLRKVSFEKESDSRQLRLWLESIQPLEKGGLLSLAIMYTISGLPADVPKSLSLAVSSLQESAADCAAACLEVFEGTSLDASVRQEVFKRSLGTLLEILPSEKEKAVAVAKVVATCARTSPPQHLFQGAVITEDEITKIVRLMKESALEEVRAMMCNPVMKICEGRPEALLPMIAPVLIEQLNKEKSIVVGGEIADSLIDLFCHDERQGLFDSLGGLSAFAEFVKSFDKRVVEFRRQEMNSASEESLERLAEIKENIVGFIKWRKGLTAM